MFFCFFIFSKFLPLFRPKTKQKNIEKQTIPLTMWGQGVATGPFCRELCFFVVCFLEVLPLFGQTPKQTTRPRENTQTKKNKTPQTMWGQGVAIGPYSVNFFVFWFSRGFSIFGQKPKKDLEKTNKPKKIKTPQTMWGQGVAIGPYCQCREFCSFCFALFSRCFFGGFAGKCHQVC